MKGVILLVSFVAFLSLAIVACGGNGQLPAGVEREIVPNPDVRVYHVDRAISDHPIQVFLVPLQDYYWEDLEEVGEVGTALVEEVAAIRGVVDVIITPYELSVRISPAFEWKDVEPAVLNALSRVLGEREQIIA